MPETIAVAAPAKVNLFLRVLDREADGYHSIETLFAKLALADEVSAERRGQDGVTLAVESPQPLGPEPENLAVLAANQVLARLRIRFGVHLTLRKRIPVGAGLGGGSSDAAAALEAVNLLSGNSLPRHELFQIAAGLGSDVAFFASRAALALGWGRGERLFALPPLPPAPVLLVVPPIAIATGEAYGWVDAARRDSPRRGALALDLDALASWGSVGRMSGNDFEAPVFGKHPEIRAAFEALAGTHPLVCRLSGSGSVVFGVYRSIRDRDDAVAQLGRKFGRLIPTETVTN